MKILVAFAIFILPVIVMIWLQARISPKEQGDQDDGGRPGF